MSVTFYGRTAGGARISLDLEDPVYLNFANGNARTLLRFLGLEPGDELSGEVATFERRVPNLTRDGGDSKRLGKVRVIEAGIDEAYFERRLGDFEGFVEAVVETGATSIWWG